jgi:chorismate dehydratase
MTRGEPPLRLGHITYSNCFPVHAGIVDGGMGEGLEVTEGVPGELNALLARGEIDVAPSSSIEFARHAERYLIIPDLVIGSRGAVRSILFLSRVAPEGLAGKTVAMPTSSATSVVLLKILLRVRWGADARFVDFDQARDDPFAGGADAALFIGDVALRGGLHPEIPYRFDLGEVWWEQTGLPFAFAVWQAGAGSESALAGLHRTLLASRGYGVTHRAELARRWAGHFGFDAGFLESYWNGLAFDLDLSMIDGLRAFYALAAEIGELPRAPELRFTG